MKAYKSLIKFALAKGYALHVHDGEERVICKGYQNAVDVIESVDESTLSIVDREKNADGKYVRRGWAKIVLGNDDNELVADYSDNKLVNQWFNNYYADNSYCG